MQLLVKLLYLLPRMRVSLQHLVELSWTFRLRLRKQLRLELLRTMLLERLCLLP